MKNIRFIFCAIAFLSMIVSCDQEQFVSEADNTFTLECSAPQWKAGVENNADTLVFGWEAATVNIDVKHTASSNEWKVRCRLDDTWAGYTAVGDVLKVDVQANVGVAPRDTYLDVVIGENEQRIIIVQGFYPRNGSTLPETGWDEDEEHWVGTENEEEQ